MFRTTKKVPSLAAKRKEMPRPKKRPLSLGHDPMSPPTPSKRPKVLSKEALMHKSFGSNVVTPAQSLRYCRGSGGSPSPLYHVALFYGSTAVLRSTRHLCFPTYNVDSHTQ